ncbi:syntaxin-like protein [Lactarius akahatsu]|uniref:Syntaxin-like protein n=1 Tax=Lactarius akahatsu TaxID=416441 RepID=A0AAD4QFV7_9AGAM|nr:syntaxin-like protein [Lactarius akahatsu]
MSLPKLTSLSTQTLSLLLERQRLQSLSTSGMTSSLHIPQITRNLAQLRSGILELESTGEHREAATLLRNQHTRMCGMVGTDAVFEPLPEPTASSSGTHEDERSWTPPGAEKPKKAWPNVGEHDFTPYSDDPEAGRDPAFLLQEQATLDGWCIQDIHLDSLSHSITRQRDLSMQINDELEVHTGLLEELDHDLDNTGSRLSRAGQRLGRVARDAKEHGSGLTIALLILVLLILIIVFKT